MPGRRLPPRPFSGAVRQRADAAILDLHGEVDSFASPMLQDLFRSAIDLNPARVVLNFEDVDYINSTGVALLVGLLAEANHADLPLLAIGLNEHYREIFEITRLSDFIVVSIDENAASPPFADQDESG